MAPAKVITQGGASFYSFSKEESQLGGKLVDNSGELSLNIANFNKMREELSDLLGKNEGEEEGVSRDQQVGYARNVQFRSLVRSGEELPEQLLPPIAEHKSPRNKADLMTTTHS